MNEIQEMLILISKQIDLLSQLIYMSISEEDNWDEITKHFFTEE